MRQLTGRRRPPKAFIQGLFLTALFACRGNGATTGSSDVCFV